MAKSRKRKKLKPFTGIERRMVPNPMITDGLLQHEIETKPAVRPGMIPADVNMVTLIGGFARVKKRTEAQTLAAARFRGLYQRAQIGGARAMDYEAVKVDVSGPGETIVFEVGDQARREYMGAVQRLGMIRSSLVEKLVVHEMSMRDLADSIGEGQGGAARERVTKQVQEAVDALAEHFGYLGTAPKHARTRADGELPTKYTGQISTRRIDHAA